MHGTMNIKFTCNFCQIVSKLEFSRQILEKVLKSKTVKIHPLTAGLFHEVREALLILVGSYS